MKLLQNNFKIHNTVPVIFGVVWVMDQTAPKETADTPLNPQTSPTSTCSGKTPLTPRQKEDIN